MDLHVIKVIGAVIISVVAVALALASTWINAEEHHSRHESLKKSM